MLAVVKGKEAKGQKALEGCIKRGETDFGVPPCHYTERNQLDSIDFLQAVETLKVNISEEDLDLSLLKRLKKVRSQQSLALILARRATDL